VIAVTQKSIRLEQIERILNQEPFVDVAGLAARVGVSLATVRRDLAELTRQGRVLRVRGGAVGRVAEVPETPFGWRYHLHQGEKQEIAELAATKVREGDTIALDIGTTPLYLARWLARRHVTVVTNSLRAADLLADGEATVVVTGGDMRAGERSLLGAHALATIRHYRFDVFFMSVGGVSARGITDYNIREIEIKQEFLRRSEAVYALADSSKFEHRAGIVVAEVANVTAILTSSGVDDALTEGVVQAGGRVERASGRPPAAETLAAGASPSRTLHRRARS
jgi:DeoR/GlpR family transcriptional regulator of sugar metabolism